MLVSYRIIPSGLSLGLHYSNGGGKKGVIFVCLRWCYRGEAVQVHLGGVRVEVRALRRADPAHAQTHRPQALQVPTLRPGLLPLRPPQPTHEETPVIAFPLYILCIFCTY